MRDEPLTFSEGPGEREGTNVVRLYGPLTLGNLFEFQAALRAMMDPVLILDLLELTYMDSAGVGLLVNAHVSAQNHGRKFALAGVSERVQALLEVTHVDQVLLAFPTAEKAEAALLGLATSLHAGGLSRNSSVNVR